MDYYIPIKNTHMLLAFTSISLFIGRWLLSLSNASLNASVVLRTLPHVIDTCLLIAGVGLCMLTQQYPILNHWLTLKIVLLLCYIATGNLALKRARTQSSKALFGLLAIAIFTCIVWVAINKPF